MALRTREDYLNSLKKLKPNIYKFGKIIEDVTRDPATRRVVESHARALDAARDPELAGIFTTTSLLSGNTIHRNNSIMTSAEDIMANSKLNAKCIN